MKSSDWKSQARESVARHRAAQAVQERLEVLAQLGTHFSDLKTQAHDIAVAAILAYQHAISESPRAVESAAIPPRPEKPCSPSGGETSASSPFFAMATKNARDEFYHVTNAKLAKMEQSVIEAKARFGEDYRGGR